MPLKALIVISGAVIASAVTVPVFAPGSPSSALRAPNGAIAEARRAAAKGDGLRLLDPACTGDTASAVYADICGVAIGPRPSVTVARQVGSSTTVLVRIPRSRLASH